MIKSVNLGKLGMGFRELAELAEMLEELAEKGTLYGQEYDLETLQVSFNQDKPEVILFDENGTTSENLEDWE